MKSTVLLVPTLLAALLFALPAAAGEVQADALSATDSWHRVVALLQYLEADYPAAAKSGSLTELEEQRAFAKDALTALEALGPQASGLVGELEAVKGRIDRGEDPEGVRQALAALVEKVVAAGNLSRSPRKLPSLEQGKALFATSCAPCHAADGSGNTAIAATMNPHPANFRSDEARVRFTPYKIFNTVGFGVSGTAMPAFPTFSEEERWALAFYVMALRHPDCSGAAPLVPVATLATKSDAELEALYGKDQIDCLRRAPAVPTENDSLAVAETNVKKAVERARAGDSTGARQALVDAYLNGVEPVEPLLRSRNPALVERIEVAFNRARLTAEKDLPRLEEDVKPVLAALAEAREGGGTRGFWSVFWFAVLILVREGFEASVVVGALLAVFRKLDQPREVRVVHVGWVTALVAGALVFAAAHKALAGANRELLEGLTALVAVGMLLYAALWLNDRAHMRRFMGEVREKMQGALAQGSAGGLFAISFMAVFRESFETAIFLQGLSIDSPAGATWGALAGLAALLLLVLGMNRLGYRLPMQSLFRWSTALLLATAVVLLGKGMHSLQEIGALPLRPVPFVRVELLGVFPDLLSLGPQLLLALAVFIYARRRPESAEGTSTPARAAR